MVELAYMKADEPERKTMPTTKVAQILWLAARTREASNIKLWFMSAGDLITGRPITSSEYYALVVATQSGTPALGDDILPLQDVDVTNGSSHHMFNAALVDLNLVVAWGAYDPTLPLPPGSSGTTK